MSVMTESVAQASPQGAVDSAPADPLETCRALIALAPGEPEPRYRLYSLLQAAGDTDGARTALADAQLLHGIAVMRALGVDVAKLRQDRAYAAMIGRQLYANQLMGAASVALGQAIDSEQPDASIMLSFGLSLQHQGRMEEAVDVFAAASGLFNSPGVEEFLIYALFHAPNRGRKVADAARRWALTYAEPLKPQALSFANPRTADRPLRVGYIGPDFTRCQVAQFIQPVLEAHDPRAVEVFLYAGGTEREEGLPPTAQWRSLAALSDDAVAELIRADRIDILVDLWGHNAGSRLCVFARRPAPVQIAWINFVQTTGLSTIDYVLHADSMDAPGTDALFIEQVWRMGEIMAPFRPKPGRPPVAPTPALHNGYVTFGCFNHPSKLSAPSIAAWAAILRARPADRLVLKYRNFIDPVLQRATLARFAAHGVAGERIEFRGDTRGEAYLAEFQQIDLALDPSPSPGGTTSCDALSNGVPLLTLKGEDFYARIGLPGLLPCGLGELVADSWDEYVAKALALTSDAHALDALRQRIRPAFDASPYCDEVGFTRGLEAQFRRMFEIWLASASA
jgi:protein O-GlcNAc transferase